MTSVQDTLIEGIRALNRQRVSKTKLVYEQDQGFQWRSTGERMGTKKVPCSIEGCSGRRIHHERPDTPRGTQWCTVKENHAGPAFCSLSCYMYHKGTIKEKENDTTT
jgi:hypothetical protein